MRNTNRSWIHGVVCLSAAALTIAATVRLHASPQGRAAGGAQQPPAGPAPGRAGGGAGIGAGPYDLPPVDAPAADRGRTVYAAQCITCHGTLARGTDTGANLVRSELVLKDRAGNLLGPLMKKGHPMQSGAQSSTLTDSQITDLMHFLRQRVNDGLRGSPMFAPQNILTGDAKAGEAYFKGEGQCTQCHSATGNLAGIGGRMDPVALQQRVVFPFGRGGARGRPGGAGGAAAPAVTTVTITPASGAAMTGTLVQMDDFTVTFRDGNGLQQTVRRVPGMKVVKNNPLQFHIDLLDRLTDKNMHDVVAYLETLK
jgi:cytochrome c oxidase cbb3-type subunit III